MDITQRTVLITGAAGGLGRTLVTTFAEAGDRVIAVDFSPTVEELSVLPGVTGVRADVSNEADVANVLSVAGALDVLVNNAAVIDRLGTVPETTLEEWQRVLTVNLTGAFLFCNAAIPAMLAVGGGSIVNIASVAGLRGGRAGAAYTASKWGLVGLTTNIAATLGSQGIRANAVCPGSIATSMGANEIQGSIFPSARESLARDRGKPGPATAQEIADVVQFLASSKAGRINGVSVPVDAGWIAY